MISSELQQDLLNCLVSQDPAIQNAISLAANYTNMVNSCEITPAEYQELLLDIQRSVNIYELMIDLAIKEQFNTAITNLISAALTL